jgi:sn-glycerol 3-phosphate transport system substrate-binding protein
MSMKSRHIAKLTPLVVALALVATACGGNDDNASETTTATEPTTPVDNNGADTTVAELPTPDPTSELAALCPVDALADTSGPVPIQFWHSMTVELEETLSALVARYNAQQDQVQVELVFQGSYTESLDKYLTALRGGTRPAMIQLEETALQLGIDSKAFIPIQACVDASGYSFDDYIERTVTAFTVEGTLWPMPYNTSNPILYANRTMLNDAGIGELPTTLGELRAAAEQIVASGVAPTGISLTSSAWIIEQYFALANQPYVDGGNGRQQRAGEVLIDNELGLEVFTWLHGMVNDGLATYVGAGNDAEHFIALALGQAAMTIDTTAALRSVLIAAQDFPNVEVEAGPMPSVADRAGGVLVGGAALWLDSETTDAERAAVWDFMTWLNEPEQQAFLHSGTGYVPIRKSAIELPAVTDLWAEEPLFRIAYDQLVQGAETVATAGPVIGNHAQMRARALVPAFERMYLQGLDPAAALAQAKSEAEAIIADYTRRIGG